MMNSAARHVTETVHPFELVFFRNLFAFLFVAPLLWRVGMGAFRTTRLPLHAGRAGLNVVNMFIWFTAVSMAPLSEVVALGFTAPIIATILSVVILREVVGIRRWSAILIGFAGALIILQPGFDTVSAGHGLTLLAASTWAGVLLMIKSLSRTDSSVTMVVYIVCSDDTNGAYTCLIRLGLADLERAWLDGDDWFCRGRISVFIGAGIPRSRYQRHYAF